MFNLILRYGVIAGVIVGGVLFGTTVAFHGLPPDMQTGAVIGYTSMLVALSFIFIAVKRHRDRNLGGVIKFLPAFGMGLGVTLVAGLFYVAAWEAALSVTKMDFGAEYAKHLVATKERAGASAEDLAAAKAEAEKFARQYADPLFRIPMTLVEILPVGVLVSLVSAGLLRNSRFLPARA